jgi:hypothetical protein
MVLTNQLIYLVNVKTKRKIFLNCVLLKKSELYNPWYVIFQPTCWRKFFISKVCSSTSYPIWFVTWHKLYVIQFYGALWKSLRYEWKWWRNHSKSHKSVVILYIAATTVYLIYQNSKPLFIVCFAELVLNWLLERLGRVKCSIYTRSDTMKPK